MIVPLREQSRSEPMQTHTHNEHIKVISCPTCLANANTHIPVRIHTVHLLQHSADLRLMLVFASFETFYFNSNIQTFTRGLLVRLLTLYTREHNIFSSPLPLIILPLKIIFLVIINNNNNAFYLMAPFKALKVTLQGTHNNSTVNNINQVTFSAKIKNKYECDYKVR